jgi:hypothetical protein
MLIPLGARVQRRLTCCYRPEVTPIHPDECCAPCVTVRRYGCGPARPARSRTAPPAVHQDAETKLAAPKGGQNREEFLQDSTGCHRSQCPNHNARGGPHLPAVRVHPSTGLRQWRAAGEMVSKDSQNDSHILTVTLQTAATGVTRASDISAVRTNSAARAGLGPGDVIHPTNFPDATRGRGFRHVLGGSIT